MVWGFFDTLKAVVIRSLPPFLIIYLLLAAFLLQSYTVIPRIAGSRICFIHAPVYHICGGFVFKIPLRVQSGYTSVTALIGWLKYSICSFHADLLLLIHIQDHKNDITCQRKAGNDDSDE